MSDAAKPKVVIVDDDSMILSALKVTLQRRYDVQCFQTAEEGVTAALKPGVAVVILDLKMPEHDGFWACRQIREAGSKVPIIFNSAYQDILRQNEIHEIYKPHALLNKDGNLKEFIASVEAAVMAPKK
jgi:DNA-binding response OmpR family regulator